MNGVLPDPMSDIARQRREPRQLRVRLIVTRQNSLVGLVTMNDIVARIIASLDEGQSPLAPV